MTLDLFEVPLDRRYSKLHHDLRGSCVDSHCALRVTYSSVLDRQGALGYFLRMLPLHQAGRSSRVGPKPSMAAPRSGSFRRAALILCALWGLSAACLASETLSPSALPLETTPLLWDQGCVIADLDGDGRPDFAIVRAEGWGSKGFQYRIELDLTTRVGLTSFSVSAQRGGLRIIPRYVNGDWDLDLVITSAWSFTPVGVWINDGHGGFTQGDLTAYSRSIWTEGPGVSSDAPHDRPQATVPQSYRSCIDFSNESYFCNNLLFERLPLFLRAASPQKGAAGWPQTRAPPGFLPQRPS
jgi:hypothetical protein